MAKQITYGDDSRDLPNRLRDARDRDTGGVIRTTDRFGQFRARRITDRDPARIVPPSMVIPPENVIPNNDIDPGPGVVLQYPDGLQVAAGGPDFIDENGRESNHGERRGYPGFDTFFRQFGPDDQFGTADDPAVYVHSHVADFAFTFRDMRGPIGADNLIMGPWLPKNFIRSLALNTDKGNPFRGRVAPTRKNVPVSIARRSFTWLSGSISPISSRNSVPPSASSTSPGFVPTAPVNAPFS